MATSALLASYETFMKTALPYVTITNEEQYLAALNEIEEALEKADDSKNDPLNPLIDMLSNAIDEYEKQDPELMVFISEAEHTPIDIALIKALMQNHKLTGSNLPEIGDKTLVSKVLNGKRALTRSAIERLSERFGLRPGMFFDELK